MQKYIDIDNAGKVEQLFDEGERFRKSQCYDEEMRIYTKVIEIEPTHAMAYLARCVTYNHIGNYQQATIECNKAIEMNPSNARAYQFRGVYYRDLDNIKYALKDFDTAIELDPCDALSYVFRVVTYAVNLDDRKRANDDFKRAVQCGDAGIRKLLQRSVLPE